MKNANVTIPKLLLLRNNYGRDFASKKIKSLTKADVKTIKSKSPAIDFNNLLLFLMAYPDNKAVYEIANSLLEQLQQRIEQNENLRYNLYNSGITGTSICAAFSFELVKWLRQTRYDEIKFSSFEVDDDKIQTVLSVIMPKIESEIMQDANAEWKGWLKQLKASDEDLLDQLIAIFDASDIRPEIKEELWNSIGINVEIKFASHCRLPKSLTNVYYHRSIIRREIKKQDLDFKITPGKLTDAEAEQVIDCSKMILVRHLREIDPTSFTAAKFVSFYELPRGYSIAIMGMDEAHRHPIDSYLSYTVFKNGVPVSYGGSWILFDSGRIGFNIFPGYRGSESKYIFQLVLETHQKIFNLKRFTADPYQIGKDNSDGIHSGAFWIYYHAGFRPLQKMQYDVAAAEEEKIKVDKKYRSPASVLKTLANSRLELVLQKNAVQFDATDVSLAYAAILIKKYNGNRKLAETDAAKKLADILQIKNNQHENMQFVLKNWALLLLSRAKELRTNTQLKSACKKLFVLKVSGSEMAYIKLLQQSKELREFIENILQDYTIAAK